MSGAGRGKSRYNNQHIYMKNYDLIFNNKKHDVDEIEEIDDKKDDKIDE